MNGRKEMGYPVGDVLNSLKEQGNSGKYAQSNLVFDNLMQLLPGKARQGAVALQSTDHRQSLTHLELKDFVHSFGVQMLDFGVNENTRIGVVVPNGPEAGVAVICAMSLGICCPINPQNTTEEILVELVQFKTPVVLLHVDESGTSNLSTRLSSAGLVVVEIRSDKNKCGIFTMKLSEPCHQDAMRRSLSMKGDIRRAVTKKYSRVMKIVHERPRHAWVLMLHTSGTSGKKKVVPYTLETIAVGAACVASSWGLDQNSICFNMMPLFHTGGIVRNLLAPLFAGGATILAPGFDPVLFWDFAPKLGATWYYAAPTMHAMIINEAEKRGKVPEHSISLIGNAAGPLLPSLAQTLKDLFGEKTYVLPSYGMTECMPITAPPLSFQLQEKIGTSGVPCGPEISIRGNDGRELAVRKIGNICVRGPPAFHGYEDPEATKEAFFDDEWFNTGDMGYLDEDGYLFITGRSKEVINRGGELISPAEIEDAVSVIEAIEAVIAISVPHNILQEVVGVAVQTKEGYIRPSLVNIQKAVSGSLHPSKWPQVVVYMDDGLPMTATNKVQRVKMSERLGLPEVSDSISHYERLFEASTPLKGAPVQEKINCSLVNISGDLQTVQDLIKESLPGVVDACVIFRWGGVNAFIQYEQNREMPSEDMVIEQINSYILRFVPAYSAVSKVVLMNDGSGLFPADEAWLEKFRPLDESEIFTPRNLTEGKVQKIFAEVLGVPARDVALGGDFFTIGGDSFKAGRAVGMTRSQFSIPMQVSSLYQYPTVATLSRYILESANMMGLEFTLSGGCFDPSGETAAPLRPAMEPKSPTSPTALFFQSIPLLFFIPSVRVCLWILFVFIFSQIHTGILPDYGGVVWGVFVLVISGMIAGAISGIVLPLLSIALKWIIIGRYKEGTYPFFSGYYIRWWLVYQILKFGGRGVFGMHTSLISWYYRLLGAKIGRRVVLSKRVVIGEADLVDIGDDSVLDQSTISPFALLPGAFYLKRISIGKRVIMGPKSIAAPGASLVDDAFVPPRCSSHEVLNEGISDERTAAEREEIRKHARGTFPKPHILSMIFVCWPIALMIEIGANMPAFLAVWGMIVDLLFERSFTGARTMQQVLLWFAYPRRYYWFIIIKLARYVGYPFLHLALCIGLKRAVLGRFKEGKRSNSQFELIRYWLTENLITLGPLKKVRMMVGPNHPVVGWIYSMLGAKVGKRIFWPGSGIDVVEYDLVEIQDDCVFGSRSIFCASDAESMKKIVIQKGSMISDRCVLYPGVNVGVNAVIGSGTHLPQDFFSDNGDVWLGNDDNGPLIWQKGDKSAEEEETLTPYGKAFHKRQADYFVWPLAMHVMVNILLACIHYALWVTPTISMLYFGVYRIQFDKLAAAARDPLGQQNGLLIETLALLIAIGCVSYWALYVVVLAVDIGGKWLIIGRRVPGNYSWDTSPYNQRWQLHKQLQEFRRGIGTRGDSIISFIQGSQYLVWYFRLLGAKIGKKVCLYPRGADPMMTEPDLVTIGDNAGIDSASLVAHINSRGVFDLNELVVGEGCVMRSDTRLLSGASMEKYSTMMENTLVVTGDVLGAGTTWQGWPAHLVAVSEARLMGAIAEEKKVHSSRSLAEVSFKRSNLSTNLTGVKITE